MNNYACDIIGVLTTELGVDLALFPFLRYTKKERTDTAVRKYVYLAERPFLHSR
jgi:hypothetical protein